MPPDSPPAAIAAPQLPTSPPPGLTALFVAFAKISLAGFGGVMVWARRGIVDQHRWMTPEEFNETYALCHFRSDRTVRGVRQNLACRVRRRDGVGAARHRRSAPLDDAGGVQRNLRALPFPAGAEHRQPV